MADQSHEILNIADLEAAASTKLSKMACEYYNSGATEQVTLRENTAVFNKYRLRPRVLTDVSGVDTSTTVFGRKISFPVCVAPTGLQKLAHPDGELANARACAKAGVCMGISSFSNTGLEEVVSAGEGKVEFGLQLYILRDREVTRSLVTKAEAVGCKAILLTADSPVLGVRWNETRNHLALPTGLGFPIMGQAAVTAGKSSKDAFSSLNDDGHSWERDIPWLRSITKMQIWIKGVLTAEDTLLAIKYGVDGVVVSNHGGRQLDGVPATLDALPECVEAAAGRIPVHVDGGFRKGSDIFKALALGADCCWVGRVAIWGLAYDGQTGVELALKILYEDFKRCMQLMGCRNVQDISRSHLAIMNPRGFLERLAPVTASGVATLSQEPKSML